MVGVLTGASFRESDAQTRVDVAQMLREAKLKFEAAPRAKDVFVVSVKSDAEEDGERMVAVAVASRQDQIIVVTKLMPLPKNPPTAFLLTMLEANSEIRQGWLSIDQERGEVYAQYTLPVKTADSRQLADAVRNVAAIADESFPKLKQWQGQAPRVENRPQPRTTTPTPPATGSAPRELVGSWRIYSARLFYDAGGAGTVDTTITRRLELNADGTWQFGNSKGTWSVSPINAADWKRWDINAYKPTRKITLNNWNGGVASGPIEESSQVDFFWVIYRAEPPTVSDPGAVHMKFGHT
jgi:hypothetical protein